MIEGEPLDGEQPPTTPAGEASGLRDQALRGGAYLAVREGAGIAVRLVGVVVVTRIIGPYDYGVYAGSAAFVALVATVCQMGMEVYLIRQPEEPSDELYARVFTFLVVTSVVATLVALAGSWGVGLALPGTIKDLHVFDVLVLSVPVNVLWAPAQAKIERAFAYRKMAFLELSGDIVLYGVAVPLAVAGAGPWSLVAGFISWQASLLVGSLLLAHLRPRWSWSRSDSRRFLSHGISFSASNWVDQLAGLANPIIVGTFFGAVGVGYVALASRLVDTLGFAQRATWRLGLVALSRIQDQPKRLARAVEEGMALQMLVTAAPLIAFAFTAHWVVPRVFGPSWTASLTVFSLLALSRLLASPVLLDMALLFVHAQNRSVAVGAGLAAALLFATGFVLVPLVGVWGYGAATLCTLPAWLYVHRQGRRIAPYHYRSLWPWVVACAPPCLAALVPWQERALLLLPGLAVLGLGSVRVKLTTYVRMAWEGIARRG